MSSTDDLRIKPWTENPRYWQYKGEPVLLLGGTWEDNLYQKANIEEHLDLLKSVGGNYIRNTMSCRDEGDVWMFAKNDDGLYDLNQWNDEHWDRFERMLKLTAERDIFPQVELWAFHDFNGTKEIGPWGVNPWRPCNNVNYSEETCELSDEIINIGERDHQFFFSVPSLNNDTAVLEFQHKFVDKILSYSFKYDHVLYCMTNEIHNNYSPEWGWYWARYIRDKAAVAGKTIEVTEMQWEIDLKKQGQRSSLDHPEHYTYFEASQNSAKWDKENRDNLLFVYDYLKDNVRPINHVKIYGASGNAWNDTDDKAIGSFWRNITGGSASSRFHRPPYGMGLSEGAQANLRSMRMIAGELDIFNGKPCPELNIDSGENAAAVFGIPGKEYMVFLPAENSMELDLSAHSGPVTCKWLDIGSAEWKTEETVEGGKAVKLSPPASGNWAVLIN